MFYELLLFYIGPYIYIYIAIVQLYVTHLGWALLTYMLL